MKTHKNKTVWLFFLPSLTGVLILFVIPYLDVARRSFLDGTGRRFTGIENYTTVFLNSSFQLASINTVRFLAVCVPLLILLSLLIAVCLKNSKIVGKWMKSVFLIPLSMPVVSIVLVWDVLFTKGGFLSGFLALFGVSGRNWLDTEYSFVILVFSYIWKNLGYDIILWLAALATIPSGIYEVANVDGADGKECFFYITLPNLWPQMFLITTLSLINGFKVFREAYLISGDYPEENIYLLQHLFNNWFRDLAVNKLAAGAVLMGIVLFVLIMIFWKLFDRETS